MQNPFVFGKAAEGVHFTDRKQDALRLSANPVARYQYSPYIPSSMGKNIFGQEGYRRCLQR